MAAVVQRAIEKRPTSYSQPTDEPRRGYWRPRPTRRIPMEGQGERRTEGSRVDEGESHTSLPHGHKLAQDELSERLEDL